MLIRMLCMGAEKNNLARQQAMTINQGVLLQSIITLCSFKYHMYERPKLGSKNFWNSIKGAGPRNAWDVDMI